VEGGAGGEKQYFLILEFLEGMPGWALRTRLKNESRLEASEAIPLFIGYLSALQFLHENSRPIIHRDIKPGNLYAPAGQPTKGKIFDLGVARDVSGTVTVGGVPGTLDYMPPEFADVGGDRGSPQSDIYALGLCFYESIAGRPVYDRLPSDINSAWMAFQQRLRKPLELTFEGDAFRQYPRLKGVIMKALAPRPADRYSRVAEMKKHLEDVLAGTGYEDRHGDESEAEMTVATLHSFSDDISSPPEPGATLGTRALDEGGGGMPSPVDLIAAGKAEVDRRQRRKLMLVAGSVAAGIVLLVGLVSWIVTGMSRRNAEASAQRVEQAIQDVEQSAGAVKTPIPSAAYVKSLSLAYALAVKTGEKYPEIGDRVDEQRRIMRKAGASLPAEFKRAFDAAMDADKPAKASGLMKEWQDSEAYVDIMGLTAPRFAGLRDEMKNALQRTEIERELAELSQAIPESLLDEDALGKGEAVALKLKALKARAWSGYEDAEKQKRLAALSTLLAERAAPYIVRVRDAALSKYRGGQDGDPERDILLRFAGKNPALAELIQSVYADARSGVEAARQSRLAQGGLSKIMDRVANARDLEAIRTVITEFDALEKDPDTKLLRAQSKSVEDAMAAKYLFFAKDYAQQAKAAYDGDRMAEGAKAEEAWSVLAASVPARFGKSAVSGLGRDIDASRMAAQARQDQTVTTRQKELKAATESLSDLHGRIGKGNLEACVDGVRTVAGLSAAALSDPGVKSQRESVLDDYAILIDRTLLQKDPLEQRIRRIKAADEILNDTMADPVLAGRVKALRDSLSKQKVGFILRFVNKAGEEVRISSPELRDKITLPKEATREIELPVRSTTVSASLLIEGRVEMKPRIETVMLGEAGGRELVITPLEKAPVLNESNAERPVTVDKTPTMGGGVSTAGVKPMVMSRGKGVLDITVAPRTATIMVDGNLVKAGSLEVAPDDNHKIMIEAPGYKMCLQYYRVRAGEVRKIEIFLEKEAKRSFFGL
ncbi:MAG: protein kinase, partial [bacterium]